MTNKNENAYKSIGEVAKLLDLINIKTGKTNTYTLRFWEKEFNQIKPKIFSGKRRYYDEKTIQILQNIKFLLKDKGMTIKGVKKLLNSNKSNLDDLTNTSINSKNILKKKLKKISNLIKAIKSLEKNG